MKRNTQAATRSPRTTPSERLRWLQRFRESGLTQREFAAINGLGLSTLGRWLRLNDSRTKGEAASPRLQEIPLQAILSPDRSWAAEVVLKDGTTLRLAEPVAAALLGKWLKGGRC